MIDVKQAVAAAREFAHGVLDPQRASHLRLEEIEAPSAESDAWRITLSMPEISLFGQPSLRREFKTFTIDKDGQIVSMRIRELTGA